MVQSCELSARPRGRNDDGLRGARHARSTCWAPSTVSVLFGLVMRRAAERVFRHYDELASVVPEVPERSTTPLIAGGARQRLDSISSRLVSESRQPAPLVERLCDFLSTADDLAVIRMRPYALADTWGSRPPRDARPLPPRHPRRHARLQLGRALPQLPGIKARKADLSEVSGEVHCESCGIDFTANFDQSVELTFVPNPAVRRVPRAEYCMGGPQVTPHIVAQKRLAPEGGPLHGHAVPRGPVPRAGPRASRPSTPSASSGDGAPLVRIELGPGPRSRGGARRGPGRLPEGHEHGRREAPRGRRAGRVERPVGDGRRRDVPPGLPRPLRARDPAPGRADIGRLDHDRLHRPEELDPALQATSATPPHSAASSATSTPSRPRSSSEGGAIVKTMGDAVMAVFTDPAAAVRAMRKAQAALSAPAESPGAARAQVQHPPGPVPRHRPERPPGLLWNHRERLLPPVRPVDRRGHRRFRAGPARPGGRRPPRRPGRAPRRQARRRRRFAASAKPPSSSGGSPAQHFSVPLARQICQNQR